MHLVLFSLSQLCFFFYIAIPFTILCLFFLFIVGALIFLSYFLFYSHLRILHCSLFLSIYYFCYPYCVLFPHFLLSVYYEQKLSSPFSSHYHFLSFDLLILFPFPYYSISLFAFISPCSFGVDIVVVGRGVACSGVVLCCFALLCQHLYTSIQHMVGVEPLSQPHKGDLPSMNVLVIVRIQREQQESLHNPHIVHSQSIQIRRSRSLHR